MQIQSTQRLSPGAHSSRTKETEVAKLDRQLSEGVVPTDVYIQPGDRPTVVRTKTPGSLPLNSGAEQFRSSRSHQRFANAMLYPMMAAPGAMLGYVGLPNAPLVGAAIGAGIGFAMAADTSREHKGKVKIDLDGQQSTRKWYGSPSSYQKEAPELRAILHSKGVLGDRIEVVNAPELSGQADPEILAELSSHKETLKGLAADRRLLGDLGGKTRYGKPALQLIDAGMARELLARGKDIQVISVDEVKDTSHQLTTEANSGIYHKKHLEVFHYQERKLDYSLSPINEPQDLDRASEWKDGKGLPDSTPGVPSDDNTFTQTIYQREEKGGRTITKDRDSSSQSLKEILTGTSSGQKPGRASSALKTMVHPSTRGYAITGGILGLAAGAAVPGLEPAIGLTLGGFAGHFIGRAAVGRSNEGTKASSTATKIAIGAGAAAGLGLGLLAAAQTGDTATVAGGIIGGLGGMTTGVLALRNHRNLVGNAGVMGFSLGAGLGIFGPAFGGGPITTIALGALGAVGGGAMAAIAMQKK